MGFRRILIAVISDLLLLVALTGCKGGGTGEGLLKRSLPANPSPEKILIESINATNEVRSMEFKEEKAAIIPATGNARATSLRTVLDVRADQETGDAQGFMEWVELNINIEYILHQNKYYWRFENKDTWYEMPSTTAPTFDVSKITGNIGEFMKNFQTIDRLEDELINGRDCYHISMIPNFQNILEQSAIVDYFRNVLSSDPQKPLTEEEFRKKLEEYKDVLSSAQYTFEYWVDKEYLVIRRIYYHSQASMPLKSDGGTTFLKLSIDTVFPKYNVKVEVTPPETAIEWKGM